MQFLFRPATAAYRAWQEAFSGAVPVSDIKVTAPEARDRAAADPRLPRRSFANRHGAIARELTKYSSYKTWAEKARGAFTDPESPGTNGANHSRRSTDR
jgi:hypothetical protein